jgi:hypothetical protein
MTVLGVVLMVPLALYWAIFPLVQIHRIAAGDPLEQVLALKDLRLWFQITVILSAITGLVLFIAYGGDAP